MTTKNIDPAEIQKFDEVASQWWDTTGDFKALHDINPLRLGFIQQQAALSGKKVLDIGCGGGILTEGMAKVGAIVSGIDMSPAALKAATLHQHESDLEIDYQLKTAEELAHTHPQQFDIVTCLEMLEHVPDPLSIIRATATLVKPHGHVFFSTLNRNVKSYLYAILGAEYILKLLPKNTHDFAKFIRPAELSAWIRESGMHVTKMAGLNYSPFSKEYALSDDVSVNYLLCAEKT